MRADDGSIVLGWMVKIAITIAVVGVLLFDGVTIAMAHTRVVDAANSAATAGMQAYATTKSVAKAKAAAVSAAEEADAVVVSPGVVVAKNGSVTVTVQVTVNTTVLGKLPGTKTWPTATSTATVSGTIQ
jgi:hypothetical protein